MLCLLFWQSGMKVAAGRSGFSSLLFSGRRSRMMCYVCSNPSERVLTVRACSPVARLTLPSARLLCLVILSSSFRQWRCHLLTGQYILCISGGLSCKFKQWENQWVPLLIHEKGLSLWRKNTGKMWLFGSHSSREKLRKRRRRKMRAGFKSLHQMRVRLMVAHGK